MNIEGTITQVSYEEKRKKTSIKIKNADGEFLVQFFGKLSREVLMLRERDEVVAEVVFVVSGEKFQTIKGVNIELKKVL